MKRMCCLHARTPLPSMQLFLILRLITICKSPSHPVAVTLGFRLKFTAQTDEQTILCFLVSFILIDYCVRLSLATLVDRWWLTAHIQIHRKIKASSFLLLLLLLLAWHECWCFCGFMLHAENPFLIAAVKWNCWCTSNSTTRQFQILHDTRDCAFSLPLNGA